MWDEDVKDRKGPFLCALCSHSCCSSWCLTKCCQIQIHLDVALGNLAVLEGWLDSMVLKGFSKVHNSMIPCL